MMNNLHVSLMNLPKADVARENVIESVFHEVTLYQFLESGIEILHSESIR